MRDSSKTMYGTGSAGSGGLERLTESRAEGEAALAYERTKRKAGEMAARAKVKAGMSTETFRLDSPVSKALLKVSK